MITNLQPAKIRGVESNGMLLAGVSKNEGKEIVKIISPKHSKEGDEVYFEGFTNQKEIVPYDVFAKLKINIQNKSVFLGQPKDKRILKSKTENINVELDKGKVY